MLTILLFLGFSKVALAEQVEIPPQCSTEPCYCVPCCKAVNCDTYAGKSSTMQLGESQSPVSNTNYGGDAR